MPAEAREKVQVMGAIMGGSASGFAIDVAVNTSGILMTDIEIDVSSGLVIYISGAVVSISGQPVDISGAPLTAVVESGLSVIVESGLGVQIESGAYVIADISGEVGVSGTIQVLSGLVDIQSGIHLASGAYVTADVTVTAGGQASGAVQVSGIVGVSGIVQIESGLVSVEGPVRVSGEVVGLGYLSGYVAEICIDGALKTAPAKTSVESFESLAGIITSVDVTGLTLSQEHRGRGTESVEFDKTGVTQSYAQISRAIIPSKNLSCYSTHAWLMWYIYLANLSDVDYVYFALGTDAANYWYWATPVSELKVGWNHIHHKMADVDGQVGAGCYLGNVQWWGVRVQFGAAADTLNNIRVDDCMVKRAWELGQWAVSIMSGEIHIMSGLVAMESGEIHIMSGLVAVESGEIHIMSGLMAVESGEVHILSGLVAVESGEIHIMSGLVAVESGYISIVSGIIDVNIVSGEIHISSGLVAVESGEVHVLSGIVAVESGEIHILSGLIAVESGEVHIMSGLVAIQSGTIGGIDFSGHRVPFRVCASGELVVCSGLHVIGDIEVEVSSGLHVVGEVHIMSGLVAVESGEIHVLSGLVAVESGEIHILSGLIAVESGEVHVMSGLVAVESGEIHILSGLVAVQSGEVHIISGEVTAEIACADILRASPLVPVTATSGGGSLCVSGFFCSGGIHSMIVKSISGNQDIFLGASGCRPWSGHGFLLAGQEAITIDVCNPCNVYAWATRSGDAITWLGTDY